MAGVAWDRLLETCYRRDADVALVTAGSPPLLKLGEQWRALQMPPLEVDDVTSLASELLRPKQGEADGYAYIEFSYGDVASYRVMAFGFPATRLLVVSRSRGSRPPPPPPPPPPPFDPRLPRGRA